MSKVAAIEFRNVSLGFKGEDGAVQQILDDVSFVLHHGETAVIAGGSGQGKSVTLKLILGLILPDSGKVLVYGEDVGAMRRKALEKLRTRFGVLFQGAALFDSMSVYDNIALPLRERSRLDEDAIKEKIKGTLNNLGLAGHEQKFPAQLSGGMQKRVGLARALQLKPDIMLFDEPTSGLDPVMTEDIYRLFATTQENAGYTSVIVSHDIPRVFALAEKVLMLHKGRISFFNNPDEIRKSQEHHIRAFVKATMGENPCCAG